MRKLLLLTTVWLVFLFEGISQTTFSIANNQTGINHLYFGFGSDMGSGVAFFNFNGDDYEDLIFVRGDLEEVVYKNNGDGTFQELTGIGLVKPVVPRSMGVITGDIDNDGYDDVLILTSLHSHNFLYHNNGDGTFTDISISAGIDKIFDGSQEKKGSYSASMGDVNQDGYLDIYINSWVDSFGFIRDTMNAVIGYSHRCAANRLYINNGDLTFTDKADKYGVQGNGCSLSSVFSDPDNDQDVDILVANDFGMWITPDRYYQNQFPQDTFYNKSAASNFDSEIYGMCVGVGDYDQDGDLDYYKTSIGRNVLLNNLGSNQFKDTTAFAQVEDTYAHGQPPYLAAGWGSGFVDIDHDSYLDLIVACGRVGFESLHPSIDSLPDRLFKNQGDGTFVDIAASSNLLNYGLSRGMAYGDYDNDGDVDIIFTNIMNLNTNIPSHPAVFRNDFQDNNRNWLKVKLEGTTINRNAIGSHIIIKVGGKSWVHEINSGGQGHTSQHSRVAHFGLGNATVVDSLIVKWGNSSVPNQVYTNLNVNQMIKIIEGQAQYEVVHWAVSTQDIPSVVQKLRVFPNPVSDVLHIEYELQQPDEVAIQIMNGLGQVVHRFPTQSQPTGRHQVTWNKTTDIPPGMYFVITKTLKGQTVEQIIIIN